MRKIIIAAAIVSFLIISGASAADKALSSDIATVTVYPDRALITRETTTTLSSGVHKLVFENLPGGIDDQSVRGWGKGTARVKLLGLNISRQDLPRPTDAEIRGLEDKIEAIKIEMEAVNQERFMLDSEKNFLDALSSSFVTAFSRGIVNGGSVGSRLAGANDLVGKRLGAIASRRIELDIHDRKLKKDLAALQEQYNKLVHPGQTEKKSLTVDLECAAGGNFVFSFNYIMRNAAWAPFYDIRADSNTGKIEIVSKALVSQRTGEDWNRVEIILSTATPQVGGEMPEPTPLVLDFQQQYAPPRGRPVGGMVMGKKAEARAAGPLQPEPTPMTTAAAEMISGETAVEFKVKTPRTIASDGKPNIVPIASDTFDGALSYIAVPIESSYAYLKAKVKNSTDKSFLPGHAAVFLAGRFVGKADLPRWSPGEEIDVPLGIDEGITITRKLLTKKTDTLLGKTTIAYEWRIEVTNNLGRPASMKLYEPIPQSRHNDIDVKVTLIEPQPAETEEGGKARWDLNLTPGTKTTINIAYKIKYPSGRQVENLP